MRPKRYKKLSDTIPNEKERFESLLTEVPTTGPGLPCLAFYRSSVFITNSGDKVLPHRFAYRLYKGKLPDYRYIKRTCGNSVCCQPAHLFLSSYSRAKKP